MLCMKFCLASKILMKCGLVTHFYSFGKVQRTLWLSMKNATLVGFFPEPTIVPLSPMISQIRNIFKGCLFKAINHCIFGKCKDCELENTAVDIICCSVMLNMVLSFTYKMEMLNYEVSKSKVSYCSKV